MPIDAHQHYWNIARGDYHWMDDNPAVDSIRCDFGPAQLQPHLKKTGILQTVVVQAAASHEETDFLLSLADQEPSIAKVVGWIDFEDEQQRSRLDAWSAHPKFAGVRPMIQDIQDDQWILREDIRWAFEALIEHGMTFDALGLPKHMKTFLTLFNRYPDLHVVLDHALKPAIAEAHDPASFTSWANDMSMLAKETDVYCKCSGLLTEASPGANLDDLRAWLDHLFSVFPVQRLMWGSDWPVLNLASNYHSWHTMMNEYLADAGHSDEEAFFGGTAAEFYGI